MSRLDTDYDTGVRVHRPGTFEVGKHYSCRSAADYDTVWVFTCVGRSAKRVTFESDASKRTVKVHTDERGEWALPLGRYSMAPVLRA